MSPEKSFSTPKRRVTRFRDIVGDEAARAFRAENQRMLEESAQLRTQSRRNNPVAQAAVRETIIAAHQQILASREEHDA